MMNMNKNIIVNFGNSSLQEAAACAMNAASLSEAGILQAPRIGWDATTEEKRKCIACAFPLLNLDEAYLEQAHSLAAGLSAKKSGTEKAWYEALPELLALELQSISELQTGTSYFELLADDRLCVHIPIGSDTLLVLFPAGHGIASSSLEAAWIKADGFALLELPEIQQENYAVQTMACVGRAISACSAEDAAAAEVLALPVPAGEDFPPEPDDTATDDADAQSWDTTEAAGISAEDKWW